MKRSASRQSSRFFRIYDEQKVCDAESSLVEPFLGKAESQMWAFGSGVNGSRLFSCLAGPKVLNSRRLSYFFFYFLFFIFFLLLVLVHTPRGAASDHHRCHRREDNDFLLTPARSLFAPPKLSYRDESGKKGRAFLDTLEKERIYEKKGMSRCSATFQQRRQIQCADFTHNL